MSGEQVATVARAMGCDDVVVCDTVDQACSRALKDAGAQDAVLIAGSLYVVGSARTYLRRNL
jgi:folylpolyglutamate synthase/dihydropteroate synthase